MINSLKYIRPLALVLGPLGFLFVGFFLQFNGLTNEGQLAMGATLWIALWWVAEVIPIYATALLPIVLFSLSGVMPIKEVTSAYGHPYVFLYLGGFILSVAIEKWNLHKRIALNIIKVIGTDVKSILLGFMISTAFISMWISNTATAVMMLPIAGSIIAQFKDNPATKVDENKLFAKAIMLTIAYSATIGGIATLIGTPPNLVLAGIIKKSFSIELTFFEWMKFGLPISMVLLTILYLYMVRFGLKVEDGKFPGGKAEVNRQLNDLGPLKGAELSVLIVFGLTVIAWMTRSYIQPFISGLNDTNIAIAAALSLFVLQTKGNRPLLNWVEAVKIPWGVIILFGGGMAIASSFKSTGLALYLGEQMTLLNEVPLILLILVIVMCVNFLTEITSNLATTAMLLPILVPMAISLDVHPYTLLVSATVAASCAFMLPVATPPNAVVFGSGYLTMRDMVRSGIWLNFISIIIVSICVYLFLPLIWDIDLQPFPFDFE